MEEANKTRSLVDDRPLTPQEIQKLMHGDSIWGELEVPRTPVKEPPENRKIVAV